MGESFTNAKIVREIALYRETKMRSIDIEKIKKKFHREWLLIAVDKFDETTTTSVTGRLLAHSPHKDEVWATLKKIRRPKHPLVTYSESDLPKGYAAAF